MKAHRAIRLVGISTTVLLALAGCEQSSEPPPVEPAAEPVEEAPPTAAEPAAMQEAPEDADPGRIDVTDAGFQTPESVLYDAEADVYLVSNIQGAPVAEDDNGFIARVTPEGEVAELKWIDGAAGDFTLDAPKGMAIADGKLYVADLDTVRVFDRETGEHQKDIAVPGGKFVNDIAAGPEGVVYVSDTGVKADFSPAPGKAAVYRIGKKGKLKKLAHGKNIGQPNGLIWAGDALWVADFGSNQVRKVGDDGTVMESFDVPKGGLDGIVVTEDGTVLVSSWEGSAVYARSPEGEVTERFGGLESPADIGLDTERNRVLVPIFKGNQVTILSLEE